MGKNDDMEELIASIFPFIRKYIVESILILFALGIASVSFMLYVRQGSAHQIKPAGILGQSSSRRSPSMITVHISGAVQSQGVYELAAGSRMKDAISRAGGLSDEADTAYFNRNFNLARYLTDQEKIYIPNVQEISNGVFTERKQIIEYLQPQILTELPEYEADPSGVSINKADKSELESLPGIGEVTAAKIIDLRPYASLDELVQKKAVKQSVFDQIKDIITL